MWYTGLFPSRHPRRFVFVPTQRTRNEPVGQACTWWSISYIAIYFFRRLSSLFFTYFHFYKPCPQLVYVVLVVRYNQRRRKNPDDLFSRLKLSAHALMETTMSRSLPPEILDLIVDHLHDETTTLKACCAVSKSWIPRTRKHLFACVELHGPRITQLWTKAFPDPHSSPARHTRTLSFEGIPVVTAAGTEVGGWIPAFCNVINLHFSARDLKPQSTLIPFYGLSPNVRSLRLTWISSEFFDLICSFPLLEDLALHYSAPRDYTAEWSVPSTSPKLTGSLELIATIGAIFSVARRLLDLPDGLHFTKITVSCLSENDVRSATDLVSRCFDTLRSLTVCCHIRCTSFSALMVRQSLIAAIRCRDAYNQPQQGHQTQGTDIPVQRVECALGRRDAPDRRIQRS